MQLNTAELLHRKSFYEEYYFTLTPANVYVLHKLNPEELHVGYYFRSQVESCGDNVQATIEGTTISSNGDSNNKNNGKS